MADSSLASPATGNLVGVCQETQLPELLLYLLCRRILRQVEQPIVV